MAENTELRFYTIDEIMNLLHVTRRTIYGYMKQGKLHGIKIGKYWHIPDESLKEFLKGDKQI